MMTLRDAIAANAVLRALKPGEIDVLERAMLVRQHPDGTKLIREGRPGDALHVIIDGEVEVTRYNKNTGMNERLRTLKGGDIFGLISLLDHGPRAATCTARGPVVVASLPNSAFQLLFHSSMPLAYHFLAAIASQLASDLRLFNETLLELIAGEPETAVSLFGGEPHSGSRE